MFGGRKSKSKAAPVKSRKASKSNAVAKAVKKSQRAFQVPKNVESAFDAMAAANTNGDRIQSSPECRRLCMKKWTSKAKFLKQTFKNAYEAQKMSGQIDPKKMSMTKFVTTMVNNTRNALFADCIVKECTDNVCGRTYKYLSNENESKKFLKSVNLLQGGGGKKGRGKSRGKGRGKGKGKSKKGKSRGKGRDKSRNKTKKGFFSKLFGKK